MDQKDLLKMAKRVFPRLDKAQEQVEAAASAAANNDMSAPALKPLQRPSRSASINESFTEGINEGPELSEAEIFGMPPSGTVHERLTAGSRALDKMARGDTNLTPNEQLGLEAIVLLIGRPALLVQDDDFGTPPDEWTSLEEKRAMLKGIIPSVGRVDLDGHPSFPWCGTAFLVGDGIAMTNRHVAQIFAQQSGKDWKFSPGIKARVDYREEYQRDKSNEFKVDSVLGIHPTYDLALLKVAMKAGRKKAPAVLTVASKDPKTTKDGDVAVIGYPAFDSRNGRTEQMDIFKNIFNVKRLQPGKSTGLKATPAPEILGHDCSTLGGNSGSCVVDLDTGQVLALHFGGQYLKGNLSVPLWKLTKDPFFKKFPLNWA